MNNIKVGDIISTSNYKGYFRVIEIQKRWHKKGGSGYTWDAVDENSPITDRGTEMEPLVRFRMFAKDDGRLTPKSKVIHKVALPYCYLATETIPNMLAYHEQSINNLVALLKVIK